MPLGRWLLTPDIKLPLVLKSRPFFSLSPYPSPIADLFPPSFVVRRSFVRLVRSFVLPIFFVVPRLLLLHDTRVVVGMVVVVGFGDDADVVPAPASSAPVRWYVRSTRRWVTMEGKPRPLTARLYQRRAAPHCGSKALRHWRGPHEATPEARVPPAHVLERRLVVGDPQTPRRLFAAATPRRRRRGGEGGRFVPQVWHPCRRPKPARALRCASVA